MFCFEMSPAAGSPGSGAGGKTPRATRISFFAFILLHFKTFNDVKQEYVWTMFINLGNVLKIINPIRGHKLSFHLIF